MKDEAVKQKELAFKLTRSFWYIIIIILGSVIRDTYDLNPWLSGITTAAVLLAGDYLIKRVFKARA